jgi:hypothetical protein
MLRLSLNGCPEKTKEYEQLKLKSARHEHHANEIAFLRVGQAILGGAHRDGERERLNV